MNNPQTRYCVPKAISIITGVTYEQAVLDIQEEIGDKSITGVFFPVALKIIKEKYGYDYRRVDGYNFEGKYLCTTLGHMLVITANNGMYRLYDTQHNGLELRKKLKGLVAIYQLH